jgi:Xaa-Pro aminopeptidase
MSTDVTLTAPSTIFQQRRARLAQALERPLVIFAGHAPSRTYPANTFPFRPASTYTYFGGPPIEHAVIVIEPGSDGAAGVQLLRPPADPDDVLWTGPTPGDDTFAAAAGLTVDAMDDLDKLEMLVAGHEVPAIVPLRAHTQAVARELDLIEPTANEVRAIVNLRLHKDEHELAAMRRAAAISVEAHQAAMSAARPGLREADAAAAYTAVLVKHGADHAFNPIITVRGEVLHGHGHGNELQAGQLLLIDAGAEESGGYACDITRTLPVSGEWTPVQRHLYAHSVEGATGGDRGV